MDKGLDSDLDQGLTIIGDKAAVMQQCLANTPEFAARLGSALQACGQVSHLSCVQIIFISDDCIQRCPEVRAGLG